MGDEQLIWKYIKTGTLNTTDILHLACRHLLARKRELNKCRKEKAFSEKEEQQGPTSYLKFLLVFRGFFSE